MENDEEYTCEDTLIVENIPPELSTEDLELYFESEKFSGGGETSAIQYTKASGKAVIIFCDARSVDGILAQGDIHEIEGHRVAVKKWRPPTPPPPSPPPQSSNTILVKGFPPNTSMQKLEMYFANSKKSSGGEIANISLRGEDEAIIDFVDEGVAERVCAEPELTLGGVPLDVSLVLHTLDENAAQSSRRSGELAADDSVPAASLPPVAAAPSRLRSHTTDLARMVEVTRLPPSTTKEMLTLFLEDMNTTGGSHVEKIDLHQSRAVVVFRDILDAEKIAQAREFLFMDKRTTINVRWMKDDNINEGEEQHELKVGREQHESMEIDDDEQKPPLVTGLSLATSQMTFDDQDDIETKESTRTRTMSGSESQVTRTILVRGIPQDASEELLKLFFENKKRTGGGEVENMTVDQEERSVIVTYYKTDDAASVLKRKSIQYNDMPLSVEGLDMSAEDATGGSSELSKAIIVKGFTRNTSEELLSLFFENRRKSGGGEIECTFANDDGDILYITFEKHETVERVMQKCPLRLDGALLDIQVMRPKAKPFLVRGPHERNKILLKGISSFATVEELSRFLQKAQPAVDMEFIFGLDPGLCMVAFAVVPDIGAIKQLCMSQPLKDSMLIVQRVARPSSIQVHNADNISEDAVVLYFENQKKSGGGEVESQHKIHNVWIIRFMDPKVIDSVVKRKKHVLANKELVVSIFYDCLGIIPPGHDTSRPGAWLPSHVDITDADTVLVEFILKHPTVQTTFDTMMNKCDAKIDWPLQPHGVIQLDCTLMHDSKDVTKKAKKWEVVAVGAFHDLMKQLNHQKITILQELWDKAKEVIAPMSNQTSDFCELDLDDHAAIVTVVGKADEVDALGQTILALVRQMENDLERSRQKITETVSTLRRPQILMLLALDFHNEMKNRFEDFDIEPNVAAQKLKLTGLSSDVIAAKVAMYELITAMISDTISVSSEMAKFVKGNEVRKYLVRKMKTKKPVIKAVWDVKNTSITLFAITQTELVDMKKLMETEVIEKNIDVTDDALPCVKSTAWSNFTSTRIKTQEGLVIIQFLEDKQSIQLITVHEIVELLVEEINNFLMQNTVLEKFLNMDFGTVRFIKQYKKAEMKAIVKKWQAEQISIEPVLEPKKPGIKVRGTEAGLAPVLADIQNMVKNVVIGDHVISAPGMPQYFDGDRGKHFLDSLENRHQVAIEIAGEGEITVGSAGHSLQQMSPSFMDIDAPDEPQIRSLVKLSGGKKIVLVKGDITAYRMDAIVNAANADLEHYGGVAKAISDKGGTTIQDECRSYVRIHGKLLPGGVFVSNAGKLPCKKVVHAVGPVWKGGFRGEANELYEAVYEALTQASKNMCRSVAVPAISSGVFGFPLDKCTETIIEATKDALSDDVHIKEVHLIDPKQKTVNMFHESLKKLFGDQVEMEGAAVISSTTTATTLPPSPTSTAFTSRGLHDLITPQGLTITSVIGAITQVQVDVIVNTTAKDLNLNNGAVSAFILQQAGPSIQAEASQQAPIAHGNVAQTSCGNLTNCQAIYHGSCVGNKDPTCERILRTFMLNCLTTAARAGYGSIAFPAIGTGNLGIPKPTVAKWMYDEAIKYGKDNPGSQLKDVKFVLYDKDRDCIKAFDDEKNALIRYGTKKLGRKRKLRKDGSDTEDLSGRDRPSTSQRFYSMPSETHKSDQRQMSVGNITLQIQTGDLCLEHTDAIVNSTNEKLDLSQGAVSQAILTRGGWAIQEECKQIGRVNKHGIAVSNAGNLFVKHVIHIDAPLAVRDWKKRVRSALKEADKRRMTSIAMPALGTGNRTMDAAQISSAILDGIEEFVKSDKPTNLNIVRITVFQPHMLEPFHDQMMKRATTAKSTGGLWNWIKSGFKSLVADVDSEVDNDSGHDRGAAAAYASHGDPMEDFVTSTRIKPSASRLNPHKLTLHIYAEKQSTIDDVTAAVDKVCKQETTDIVLESLKDQETIARLNDQQVAQINSLEKKYPAKIKILRGKKLNRITISCNIRDQGNVIADIYTLFRQVEDAVKEEEQAELLCNQVQWEVEEGEEWEKYPSNISVIIEKAYLAKLPVAEWPEKKDGKTTFYCVDLGACEEYEKANPRGDRVKVRRKIIGGESLSLPSHWGKMKDTDTYIKVPLNSNDQEYIDVAQKFQASVTSNIVKIERIQNRSLFQRYQVHKQEMEKVNPPNTNNEVILWHGTSADTLENINCQGFNRSYCGKNATALGNGVYFARDASYSAAPQYSRPDPNTGYRHMYQSRVLCGEYARGSGGMRSPPVKTPPAILYDCVVDNTSSPSIYVIFSDTQAYPEYLVTFQ